FVEKYGSPWLGGKNPRQTQPHEIEDLLDSMEKMLGTAVAAIPNDSTIELLESGSKGGSSQVFDDFLRYCKSEIAIAILGQNQTTEAEANRASATAGLEKAKAIRHEDAAFVVRCVKQAFR
ncbi:phage portal protein family protein, partial [Avibacterium paragallinarum]|uniref:phage portal protein family protein n=1 Tax=Avibacterium paragallinarum TaxID=728 RepID=UPI00054CE4D9